MRQAELITDFDDCCCCMLLTLNVVWQKKTRELLMILQENKNNKEACFLRARKLFKSNRELALQTTRQLILRRPLVPAWALCVRSEEGPFKLTD